MALTDPAGRFRRYKIVDPSFHNWIGPRAGLRGQADLRFPASATRASTCPTAASTSEAAPTHVRPRHHHPPPAGAAARPWPIRRARRRALPDRHGGALRVEPRNAPRAARECVPVCPTQAITRAPAGGVALDLGRCLFCAACVEACPHGAITQTGDHRMAARTPRGPGPRASRARRRSGWPRRSTRSCAGSSAARCRLRQVSAGGCGAVRGRPQRARHHRLGPRPLRHPVRRLAAPRGRPAHHRTRHAEHGAGAEEDLGRRARAEDRRSPSARARSRAARSSATRGPRTAPRRSCRLISTSPAGRRIR